MIGRIINERYQIYEKLAAGSQSEVFLAYDTLLNNKLKVIKALQSRQLRTNNFHEVNILTKIYSTAMPNISDVHYDEFKTMFLVMDYIDGIRLDKYVITLKRADRIFTFRNALFQLSNLLFELHSHKFGAIIHCDLKPDNIIVSDNGTFKLLDFGIAVDNSIEFLPLGIGNINFSSPELYLNHKITPNNDLFSLGCVLFYIISGGALVTSSNLRKLDWSIGLLPFEINIIIKLIEGSKETYTTLKNLIDQLNYKKFNAL